MPQTIMPLNQWLALTDGGFTSTRSNELKAVDIALKNYHAFPGSGIDALQKALTQWITSKGPTWKTSVRNKKNAVETLYKQIHDTPTIGKTAEGMYAISLVRDESRAIVNELFKGKNLEFRSGLLTKIAGNSKISKAMTSYKIVSIPKDINTLSNGKIAGGIKAIPGQVGKSVGLGGGQGNAMSMANKLLAELAPMEILGEVKMVLAEVMPNFITELAASLTPWLGIITSGGGVLVSACTTFRAGYRLYDARENAERSLSVDEPAAAIGALIRILERERNFEVAGLSIGVADFAGKLAGVLLDGGTITATAVGLTSKVVKLALIVRIIVRDVLEKNEYNKLSSQQNLDIKVFQACPLVGAYFICCVPTSVLVNTIFDDFYQHGIQDKVEHAVKTHLEPLREQARRVIEEHRMTFPHLQNYHGVKIKNDKKIKEMLK